MFLKKLNLLNFRNYAALNLELDEQPTILVGNNAAGKSNLLEAIYFLSTTKSGRVDEESELIKQGEGVALISGLTTDYRLPQKAEDGRRKTEDDIKLEITLQNIEESFSKKVKVNGVPRRVTDYIGNLPTVIFYPWDINMVTGAPSLRRWHLDMALAQVDSAYKRALTLYEQVLTNRNRVLKRIKEGQGRIDELDFWTEELIKNGQVIQSAREAFLQAMNSFNSPLGKFVFEYKESLLTNERLHEYNGREIQASVTLIGPHRDDFVLKMDRRNLGLFGSRGEQRLATLVFKLATLEYMALTLGERPILLLDDVFSELDQNHRAAVVEVVSRQQTIISAVELENLPKDFLNSARILKVTNGEIHESS